ncbi:(Fe-S)-binding protein [Ammonifex thiophilus]|uniref:(Fe-S)-binding protein n=1 Tax=Ammonifex thiophilus TaxID=444093 RepID=A0A3D8P7G2_9THEO|nr:(Fe-S)-binding protein [Ammonifex thiophilus]RDV84259.1 (Fe-S)-binding protein [Ammonifex thiophilus]
MALELSKVADPTFRDEIAQKIVPQETRLDFNYCLSCGTCDAGCEFKGLVEGMEPRRFMRKIALGLREEVLNDPFVWLCNQCGRCTMECPMGINMPNVIRCIRGKFGLKASGTLQETTEMHVRTGNQMGVSLEDFVETVEWMEEELRDELGDDSVKFPVDVKGAEIFLLLHPREIGIYPEALKTMYRIFSASGVSWTISTKSFDVTNFGLFDGRDDMATKIMQFTVDAFKELGCKRLVCTECGHGYWALVFGSKYWVPFEYPILHMVEFLAEIIKDGRIKVDKSKNPERVTLHDPCNLVRKAGVAEPQRYVLSQVAEDFVEMWPNREYNICCGGGGGALALDQKRVRMQKALLKKQQIERTGAQILVSPCHNCFDQFTDMKREYKMPIQIKYLMDLVDNALVR